MTHERPASYGTGWIRGSPQDYDRDHCIDLAQFSTFVRATQPEVAESLDMDRPSPTRRKFLVRLDSEIAERGTRRAAQRG